MTVKRKRKPRKKPEITTNTLTSEESAIVSRVESESTKWFGITEDDINDFSLMADPLLLPPAAQILQEKKKYAFRWCERTPKRIDQLCKAAQPPLKWALVNRTTLPKLADEVDDILGCVCRLDQALLFKPWKFHAIVQRAKSDIAENADKSGQLDALKERAPDGVEIMTGPQHKVTGSDDIQFDEEAFDASMGVAEDSSGLGELVVAE